MAWPCAFLQRESLQVDCGKRVVVVGANLAGAASGVVIEAYPIGFIKYLSNCEFICEVINF